MGISLRTCLFEMIRIVCFKEGEQFEKRTNIAYSVAIFTLIACFSMVACTLGKSKRVSSEEELKQFISEDFGASLLSMGGIVL